MGSYQTRTFTLDKLPEDAAEYVAVVRYVRSFGRHNLETMTEERRTPKPVILHHRVVLKEVHRYHRLVGSAPPQEGLYSHRWLDDMLVATYVFPGAIIKLSMVVH